MFEKIFGIFRKKKKDDFSAEIPGDTDEEMFDLGDSEMEDDFDADTISLETGMSDGDFSGSSGGGMAESDPEFGDSLGDLESPGDDVGIGMLDLEEDSAQGIGGLEEPVTPPPEVEPMEEEPFAVPAPKRSKKGLLVTVGIVVVGLLVGFLLSSPASIEAIKRATSSEPTIQEQLGALTAENADLKKKLEVYRSVGTMEEILATKAEIKKREEISADIKKIAAKIADRSAAEDRLDRATSRLNQVRRGLIIQQGTFANVEKSLKQIEARNNYLISSTRMHLDQIEEDAAKSEELRARLDSERVKDAEAAAMMSRDIQQEVERTAFEALSSL